MEAEERLHKDEGIIVMIHLVVAANVCQGLKKYILLLC